MNRSLVLAAALLSSASVFAQSTTAELSNVEGQVRFNAGEGFQSAGVGTQVQTGYLVSVSAEGSAILTFADGCRYELRGGTIATLPAGSPCAGFAINVQNITAAPVATGSQFPLVAYIPIGGAIYVFVRELTRGDDSSPPFTPPLPVSP